MSVLVDKLSAMNQNFIFSGQLFIRHQGPAVELDMSTRELFGVCGVIAVPKNVRLKGEHQYSIAGYDSKTNGILFGLDTDGIDLTEKARGSDIGHLLTRPIWRI